MTPVPTLIRSAIRKPGDPILVAVMGDLKVPGFPTVALPPPPHLDPDVVVAREADGPQALQFACQLHAPLVLLGWQGRAHVVVGTDDPEVLRTVIDWVASSNCEVIWPS